MPLRFYRSFRRGGRVGIVGQVIIALRRVEFKSKAVVHFDQHKAPIASPSLADNSAIHTVAINALTVCDVIYPHPH